MNTPALALGLAALVAAPVAAQDTYRIDGDRIAIYNVAGHLEVVPGSGSDVTVTVTPRGDDASRLSVDVDDIRGRNTLRVLYPDDRVIYPGDGRSRYSTTLEVRSDGTFGDGDRVNIRSSGSGLEAWADLRVEIPAGRDVAIWLGVGETTARGIRGDLNLDISAGRVEVEDHVGALLVDTGSGSVTVTDIQGELEVDTGSGSVRAEGVDGPLFLVDTGSGSVHGRDIRADRVRVDTGSGGIDLLSVSSPDLELDTGSGSIEAEVLSSVERLIADTGSGGVELTLPDDVDADLELDTGSGRIEVDFPIEVRVMRRDHVEGRIGDGRGLIEVDTGSGSIRIRRGAF